LAPWPIYAHVTNLGLTRLSRREASAMIDRVTAGKALPAEVLEQILLRTDGVPLFVEELTKTVIEGGLLQEREDRFILSGPLPSLAIPTTLHASLMARLDRSMLVKEIAQIGAAIGREFSYALLRAVVAMDEAALKEALGKLEKAELASCRGKPPEATYSFKHALVQDTAYASLVRSRRRELHRQIAEALRDRFSAVADAEPEIIAHHFTEAGLPEPAIQWWSKAGEQSLRRSAITEASSHLKKAIDLAEECGSVQVGDRLRLQISYGQALMAAKGYGAAETTAAFARARGLASGIEDASERFSVYYGLWVGSFIRGELAPMRELAAAFLSDVEKSPGRPETASAHRVVGLTRWFEGDFLAARAQLERAMAESDTKRDRSLAFRFGQDPGVASMLNLAVALGPLGDIRKAHELLDTAWTQAQQGGHIPTIAYTHGQTCIVEGTCRDVDRVRPHAHALTTLSREHGLQLWRPVGSFFHQWVAWREGRQSTDISEMRSAMAQFRIGFQPLVPLSAVLLAEIEGERGEPDAGLFLLEDLLKEIERTGQRWLDAEVHRQRGELLLRRRPVDTNAAEAAFELALATARGQRARTFELRAAIDLARLWRDDGKRDRARDLLAPVYGSLSEASSTRDLKDAQTLLEELL
jgi:predicted ATPase